MASAPTIGFIGAGNMATALIKGLLAGGTDSATISVADPDSEKTAALAAGTGIQVAAANEQLAGNADIIVVAVKPQVMEQVLTPLAPLLTRGSSLLISVAAGLPLAKLGHWTHEHQAIVRCMPNTPALVGMGASALIGNDHCTDAQREQAENILAAAGKVVWLDDESQMDAVTALSGSGPAYFFLLMEAMQAAGAALGLPDEMAASLSVQTALGAATLADSSDAGVAELRRRVTSPGGTTEAALKQFESEDFRGMVARALQKAADRSRELAG